MRRSTHYAKRSAMLPQSRESIMQKDFKLGLYRRPTIEGLGVIEAALLGEDLL